MKKTATLLTVSALILALSACGNSAPAATTTAASEQPAVTTAKDADKETTTAEQTTAPEETTTAETTAKPSIPRYSCIPRMISGSSSASRIVLRFILPLPFFLNRYRNFSPVCRLCQSRDCFRLPWLALARFGVLIFNSGVLRTPAYTVLDAKLALAYGKN